MPRRKSSISKAQSYREIGEFWDTHDLSEHWEQTQPAEFEADLQSEATLMAQPKPLAFMSYARFDDRHDDGRLTQFRERLSSEVQMQTGDEFPIFQDRKDILWGQHWKERIAESIDGATFLIPIITPGFFRSQACRDELQRFIDREKKLGRNDLILPVYYVDSPLLNDEERRTADELVVAVAAHQYADWRELRFEPFTSPDVGKRLAQMAVQVRNALERVRGTGGTAPPLPGAPTARRESGGSRRPSRINLGVMAIEAGEATRGPAAKTEPPTIVVDAMGTGDYLTITEAIQAAGPGTLILVRPGLYQEGLVIDKPLEIIGDGDRDEIEVQATGKNAVLFKTTMGRVANLTLRQIGGGNWFCVDIAQGRLLLEDCDITSQGRACVVIHGGADPRVRRNRIHDSGSIGVSVFENGQGTLEDNDIFGNTLAGVAISDGGNPTLRRNRINRNSLMGIAVVDGGGGTFEDNDLRDNGKGAWFISAVHDVPKAELTISPSSGPPGTLLKVTAIGYKAFTPVTELKIGNIDVRPVPVPATDDKGGFTATVLVPQLTTGSQTVTAKVGDTVASAAYVMTVAPPVKRARNLE